MRGRKIIISSLTETREVYRVQSRQMFGPALSAYVSNLGRLPCKGLREIALSYQTCHCFTIDQRNDTVVPYTRHFTNVQCREGEAKCHL